MVNRQQQHGLKGVILAAPIRAHMFLPRVQHQAVTESDLVPDKSAYAMQSDHPLPRWAVVVAVVGLAIPGALTLAAGWVTATPHGPLVWLGALAPVVAYAYHRGVRGGAFAATAGLIMLAAALAGATALGRTPSWPIVGVVALLYAALAGAVSVFAEFLRREQREAERLALLDPLTRLANRRHADGFLDREFAAAMRGRKLAVVLWDIDHFKQFNDRHGHAVGDEALRAFAAVLEKHTRRQNLSARFGGEEFISIVTDVPLDGVLVFVNRVREELRASSFAWGPITVSVGVAMHQPGMGSYEVLVAAADRALYMAKHAGRDRVEVIREGAKRVSQPGAAPPKSSDEATRVFVVHDDPNERDAIVEALKGHGYAVEAPASAHEAAQRLLRGSERVDLLITSLILPRVSGFALVEQLSATAPELRVIYLADGMRQRVSWVGVPGTVARFVAKPVDTKALADTVREVLAEPAPAAGGFETQSAAAPGPR